MKLKIIRQYKLQANQSRLEIVVPKVVILGY